MKTIPFSLDKYIPGKSIVQTRDGRSVRILATDLDSCEPIAAIVGGEDHVRRFSKDGYCVCNEENSKDIFLVVESRLRAWKPEEVPLGCWIRKIGESDLMSAVVCVGPTRLTYISAERTNVTYANLLEKGEHSIDGGKTWLPCGVEESQ